MNKTLSFFKRKASEEKRPPPGRAVDHSNACQYTLTSLSQISKMDLTSQTEENIAPPGAIARKPLNLEGTRESVKPISVDGVPQHDIHHGHTPSGPSLSTNAALPSATESNPSTKVSSSNKKHKPDLIHLLESEQQMASAIGRIKTFIEAEEQFRKARTLLKALDLYLLTDQTFRISRFFSPLFPMTDYITVEGVSARDSSAVHAAWLEILPHHLKAICTAAEISHVRDQHDLEWLVDVSPEVLCSAEHVVFIPDLSHAEQRARMTTALIDMKHGLPELVNEWKKALCKMRSELLNDLGKVVDGKQERRKGRIFR